MSSSPNGHYPSQPVIQDQSLWPFKSSRNRSISRPSSRSSCRTHSPSLSLDDPVAVRNHMSTLKHNIRQQQAQLNNLENVVRSGQRPYASEIVEDYHIMASSSTSSTPPSSFIPNGPTSTKMKRRSSHDVLLNIAGPDSSLPLPRRDPADENGIQEGVPMTFGVSSGSPTLYKRVSSPTRTLSRIPVASVGNARALADEGQPTTTRPSPSSIKLSPIIDPLEASTSSLQPPPSPNRRSSLTPGGTTKVLADLQAGVSQARVALDNTKAQLRLSQRSVASLTRQTEDLKESRERLRLENEGLNNVVARKERLLQEVLERARKAEGEAAALKAQLKTETTTSKKTIREMEATLSESTALSQKSEREYITLRDSMKGMAETWKQDTDRLREEMRRREEKLRIEGERLGKMYKDLVEKVKGSNEGRELVKTFKEEDRRRTEEVESLWKKQIETLKLEVDKQEKTTETVNKTAQHLAAELARLRRLMQFAGRNLTEDDTLAAEKSPP